MTTNQLRFSLITLLIAIGLMVTGYWWQRGRPVSLPDAPATRIACVSYAPYHYPGQSPFNQDTRIAPAQIEHDLTQLSEHFNCVRTYSVAQGLAAVPGIAQRHGMKVLLGIWLGRDRAANAREIALGIKTARANRDAIRAVVVGNEVLLRGELPASELTSDIRAVRSATGLPVTYADVWEYWLKYPQVANAVSFITIHILPYWEDHPVAIEDAVAHVQSVYERLNYAFPGKTILIGETGWPSAGRQRGGALPSRVNEARFVRGFLGYAARTGVAYNLVEAYDQPWKRWLEGTAGGAWGLYSADGNAKFSLRGPVIEDPLWYAGPLAGVILALVFWSAGFFMRQRQDRWYAVGLLLAGYTGGAILMAQTERLLAANRDAFEWLMSGSWTLLELLTVWVFAQIVGEHLQEPHHAAMPKRIRFPLGNAAGNGTGVLELLQFAWLFAAAVVCLLLVFDPRYRGFQNALFMPAGFGFALLSLTGDTQLCSESVQSRILATWLGVAAVLIVVIEGVANGQALLWAALCAGFCVSVWVPQLRLRQQQHPDHQSNRAGLEAVPHQTGGADNRGQPRRPA